MDQGNAVTQAIQRVGLTRLATRLGVSYQAVRKWERRAVPADRVLALVRAADGAVRPFDLRPDLYPDPAWMPPGLAAREELRP
jgi:DNA-binding transcriptional regulator YdaS (Cro superfamily)